MSAYGLEKKDVLVLSKFPGADKSFLDCVDNKRARLDFSYPRFYERGTYMIGSIAAILTTFAFLPQVIKVIKTKGTESIALCMYLMQVVGIALWLFHGLVIDDLPLIMANGVSLILSGTILYYKLKYK